MKSEHLERVRQQEFIDKMVESGYELFVPKSYTEIKLNFKKQLEHLNAYSLSDNEFKQAYDMINQGTVFGRTWKLLREINIQLDNGKIKVLKLIDKVNQKNNVFQIAQEVVTEVHPTETGARFDSIIFINGLPLVIMEFKQSLVGVQKGIDQIIGYQQMNKMHDLFLYCQIFVASSFATTRYFANNNEISRDFIFKWTDQDNYEISNLIEGPNPFYKEFLNQEHLYQMIVNYIIQEETPKDKKNLILRPYQFYATKIILDKVKKQNGGGYIFHTTGSGKTITSFKTCRILSQRAGIDKVIFLVDRKDLDSQTKLAYESYEEGSYEGANNSHHLKSMLFSNDNRIVVATIQKMTKVIGSLTSLEKEELRAKRVVIVIDECHRSQSDETTNSLRDVFVKDQNAQYFGFTGTPIFDLNAKTGVTNYRTTKAVFGEELHRYTISNAVEDESVLQFNIFQPKQIEGLDQDHLNQKRIKTISQYIIDDIDKNNDQRNFNAILATSSKEHLKLYYHQLKSYNQTLSEKEQIKFTCIFSTNPDDREEYADNQNEDEFVKMVIADYNQTFNGNEQTNNIEGFKNKIYDNIRKNELDLVIVVNMLLTGFDSKLTKTLFVDKPLKYHGLLQAYSRVNRKAPHKKFGNIVTFIDQKEDRDHALSLFSGGGTSSDFEIKPCQELVTDLNQQVIITRQVCQNGEELRRQLRDNDLQKVEASLKEIKELQKQYAFLKINPEFDKKEMNISVKELNDLKDVYREVYNSLKGKIKDEEQDQDEVEKVQQTLGDFDFDISLFDEDLVNLEYLLRLTQTAVDKNQKQDAEEQINNSDLPKELRISSLEAIDKYSQNPNQEVIEYMRESLEEHKENEFKKYAELEGIDNYEEFRRLGDIQRQGNLSKSQARDYDKLKNNQKFLEKRAFRKRTYQFVEEINSRYDLEHKIN